MGRAEGGEVMAANEELGRFLHRVRVERLDDAPYEAAFQRQRGAAVGDPVDIGPAGAGEAGVPIIGHSLAGEDGDRIGAQARVHRLHEAEGSEGLFYVGVRAHREAVNARVGAASCVDDGLFAGDGVNGVFQCLLDAGAMRLALPAHEGAAIKFYGEGEAGHMIMFVKLLAFGLAALAPTPSPSLEREGAY